MRTSIRALAAATLLGLGFAASPAFAEDEAAAPDGFSFSGYVQGVTDYRYRGVSLTAGDPAIQGSINVNHASGFYAGAWASSLEDSPVFGSAELDVYAGWTGKVSPDLTVDAGLLMYVYPNGHFGDANYFEPYASIATDVGPVNAKLGVAYAFDGQDALGNQDNLYVFTDLAAAIPNTPVTLNGHVGYTDGALSFDNNDSSFDWSVGASATVLNNVTVGISYIGVEDGGVPTGFKKNFTDDTFVASIKLAL
ncbi:MAG: TorF family putative porin [Novosphingobium sp.]